MQGMRCGVCLAAAVLLLVATGCSDGKDEQIQALQQQNRELEDERVDLLARLNDCLNNRDRQASELSRLRSELQDASRAPRQSGMFTELTDDLAYVSLSSDVLFASGRATLSAAAKNTLQQVVNELRSRYSDRQIWVVGHTDSDPIRQSGWKDNLELSVQRAASVFRELQSMGLDPKSLVAAGRGDHSPRAANDSERGKQLNRRVQIVAIRGVEFDEVTPTTP